MVVVVVAMYGDTETELAEPISNFVIPSLEDKVILGVQIPAREF
jgi:hypothetical protein